MRLRCSIVGFERNYRANIPSKQFNIRKLSTFKHTYKNPWVITGLIDSEGSFSIIIDKNKTRKLGSRVQTKFQLDVHIKDLNLLRQLQEYLDGIGSIHISRDKNRVNFSVNSKKDLMKLINHLEKYPLQTQKAADFFLFKQAVELISNKAHITTEGLNQIVNIKSSMN